jgi:hypothetical protein
MLASLAGAALFALLHPLPPLRGLAADLYHLAPARLPFAALLLGAGLGLSLPAAALGLRLRRPGRPSILAVALPVALVLGVLALYPLARGAWLARRFLDAKGSAELLLVREAPESVEAVVLRVVPSARPAAASQDLLVPDGKGRGSLFGGDPFLREPDRPEDSVGLIEVPPDVQRRILEGIVPPLLRSSRPLETVYDRATLKPRHPARRCETWVLRGGGRTYAVSGPPGWGARFYRVLRRELGEAEWDRLRARP